MVKTRFSAVLMILTLAILVLPAQADHAWVIDDASLYSAYEEEQIEELVLELVERYQMDIGVWTTREIPYSNGDDRVSIEYADAYYEDNGYGLGDDRAGVLFVLDMNNRYNYLSTAGTMMDYLNDRRIDAILSSADEYLSSGQYGQAMLAELKMLQKYLRAGIEEGTFRYDEETGERISGIYNRVTWSELLISLLVGAAAALAFAGGVSAAYHLKGKTYKYSLSEENIRVDVLEDNEQYLREHTTRVPIVRSSGGGGGGGGRGGSGSGVHISSGGMSHGGGGHHF